ncbi:uncharacterized protein LOC142587635 [Dermacentor variabilis]|uniref:uncharacterized protein LOC142587635 n=1 Tax=Dermacentor variabilis TaxID=34621 RepID=UPI003F5C938A
MLFKDAQASQQESDLPQVRFALQPHIASSHVPLGVPTNFLPRLKQRERLSGTSAGKTALSRAGMPPHPQHLDEVLVDFPRETEHISVAALPRDMHPGRRIARVERLHKQVESDLSTTYVDAARYHEAGQGNVLTVVHQKLSLRTSLSTHTASSAGAEATAIAMAIREREHDRRSSIIISDSQDVCCPFTVGRVPAAAMCLVQPMPIYHHRLV